MNSPDLVSQNYPMDLDVPMDMPVLSNDTARDSPSETFSQRTLRLRRAGAGGRIPREPPIDVDAEITDASLEELSPPVRRATETELDPGAEVRPPEITQARRDAQLSLDLVSILESGSS